MANLTNFTVHYFKFQNQQNNEKNLISITNLPHHFCPK